MFFYIIFTFLILTALFCAWQMAKIDWKSRIIPDIYLFPFLIIGLIITVFFEGFWIISPTESVIAGAFGYFLSLITGVVFAKLRKTDENNAPIGLGDVKLISAGGIWLGATGLSIAILISCILGQVWGMKNKQKYIPFAPFFISGLIIAFIILYFLL